MAIKTYFDGKTEFSMPKKKKVSSHNNYENERSVLESDVVLASLCKSYVQAVRIGANETAFEIRHRTMDIYKFSSRAFLRYVKASRSGQISRRSKIRRLSSRIRGFLERGKSQFVTITWSDDTLSSNSSQSRKRFVRTALNDCSEDFVANIDFGKTTHREHYHAVVLNLDEDSFRSKTKPFGFVKIEKVIPSTEGSLALYVDKLCNHALKESTCKQLMYCRKRKK